MIFEGLKLATVGMLVVFSFLVLLVLVIKLSAWLLRPFTNKEERELMIQKRKHDAEQSLALGSGRFLAVITAAVSAHRARLRALRRQ